MSQYFYDMIPAEELRQLSYIPTVAEFVAWIGEKYADNPAISDLNQTLTYRQMCERIARRRAFIESLGLPKGAHIAIFDRNSQDAIELFLAVTSAGYVAMNLPSALPERGSQIRLASRAQSTLSPPTIPSIATRGRPDPESITLQASTVA